MKVIILARDSETRLYPVTQIINKHLLPIYNKPMIYYPLSLIMLLKIREFIFVINPKMSPFIKRFSIMKKNLE